MGDDTNNGAESTVGTVEVPNDLVSLESYIASSGKMNWRQCLTQWHDICFKLEGAHTEQTDFGAISIRSFVVRKDATTGDAIIEMPDTAVAAAVNRPSETSIPKEAYMSPEQCLDRTVDRRSDIYSLGCVMYHCLTGAPPFLHRDPDKLKEMQAIDYALPPGRRSQRNYIPDEVDALISNCLEKDPGKRFKNAADLRANIGRVLQLEDDTEEMGTGARFAEFLRQKRKVLYGVAGLIVVTTFFGYWTLSTTSSDDFSHLIDRTAARHRNRYFLTLEHGQKFLDQMEFENGQTKPPPGSDPIEVKVLGEDVVLFASTKRKSIKEAAEEASKRRLILWRADLAGKDLKRLSVPVTNMEQAFFMNSNLDDADFHGSLLKESNFSGASMKNVDGHGVSAERAVFQKANLEDAKLAGAVLIDCDFSGANLKNADLSGSYLLNANLKDADVTGAKFKAATATKDCLDGSNLSAEQKAEVKIVEGPTHRGRYVAPGPHKNAPQQQDEVVDANPFTTPSDSPGFNVPGAPMGDPNMPQLQVTPEKPLGFLGKPVMPPRQVLIPKAGPKQPASTTPQAPAQ